jgi:hypothetical protein
VRETPTTAIRFCARKSFVASCMVGMIHSLLFSKLQE